MTDRMFRWFLTAMFLILTLGAMSVFVLATVTVVRTEIQILKGAP